MWQSAQYAAITYSHFSDMPNTRPAAVDNVEKKVRDESEWKLCAAVVPLATQSEHTVCSVEDVSRELGEWPVR